MIRNDATFLLHTCLLSLIKEVIISFMSAVSLQQIRPRHLISAPCAGQWISLWLINAGTLNFCLRASSSVPTAVLTSVTPETTQQLVSCGCYSLSDRLSSCHCEGSAHLRGKEHTVPAGWPLNPNVSCCLLLRLQTQRLCRAARLLIISLKVQLLRYQPVIRKHAHFQLRFIDIMKSSDSTKVLPGNVPASSP